MIPSSLSNYVSPIVDKALETGARGSTTTSTNYGVIGDAFAKKAQLDLDMARLQTDVALRSTDILVGVEQSKLDLELDKANMAADYDIKKRSIDLDYKKFKYEQKMNQPTFFEQILGAGAGIAQGAAIGSKFGGHGALIGGAIGGIATFGASQQGGRKGLESSLNSLDKITSAVDLLDKNHKERKNADTLDTLLKTGQNLLGAANDPNLDSQSRLDAIDNYNTHLSDMYKFQVTDMKASPEQAAKSVEAYDKMMRRGGIMDTSEEGAQLAMTRDAVDFASEIQNSDDPAEERSIIHKYRAKHATNMARLNGGKYDAEASDALFETQLDAIDDFHPRTFSLGAGNDEVVEPQTNYDPVTGEAVQQPVGNIAARRKNIGLTPSQRASTVKDNSTVQDYAVNANPRNINNPGDQSIAPSIGARGQYRAPTAQGSAVMMDDGGPMARPTQPAAAEMELAKLGGDAVKQLKDDVPSGRAENDFRGMTKDQERAAMFKMIKKANPSASDEEIMKVVDDELKTNNRRGSTGSWDAPEDVIEDKTAIKQVDRISTDPSLNKRHQRILQESEAVPPGDAKAVLANIDRQIAMIENGEVKEFDAPMGKQLGYHISKSGVGGKKLGEFIGPLGKMGKGKNWVNSSDGGEKEVSAWRQMDQLSDVNTIRLARVSGEKGPLQEADKAQFDGLGPSPAKSKKQAIADLLSQKELVLSYVAAGAGGSQNEKDQLDIENKRMRNKLQRRKLLKTEEEEDTTFDLNSYGRRRYNHWK